MESLEWTGGLPAWGAAFFIAVAALSGASLASFANVVIYRVPLDMSISWPPSACPSCGHRIRWFENIPILSFLALRGRCASCSMRISPRYPLVELMGAAWGLVLGARWLWPTLKRPELWAEEPSALYPLIGAWALSLIFVTALIAVAYIDLEYTFIPDEITLPVSLLGVWGSFTLATWLPSFQPLDALFGALTGWLLIVVIREAAYLYYRREAMGLGDAKLLMMIGAFLGWQALPLILLAASLQGVAAALLALLYSRVTGERNELTMTARELDERFGEGSDEQPLEGDELLAIPFGPFLALSAFELLAIGPKLFSW